MSTNDPSAPEPQPSSEVPPTAPPAPPAGQYGAPPPVAPPGVPRPGELLDRFLARLIDGLILGVAYGILAVIFGAILIRDARYDVEDGTLDDGSTVLYYFVLGIVLALLSIVYYSYMESSRGQTLGKMAMKLRVYGPDGTSNPTLEQAVRRNIWTAFPLAFVIPVVGQLIAGVGALIAEIMIAVGINSDTVNRQAWHDHFAGGTRVVKIG
jgi:uncharacterized RDD family membrane protein YckC